MFEGIFQSKMAYTHIRGLTLHRSISLWAHNGLLCTSSSEKFALRYLLVQYTEFLFVCVCVCVCVCIYILYIYI